MRRNRRQRVMEKSTLATLRLCRRAGDPVLPVRPVRAQLEGAVTAPHGRRYARRRAAGFRVRMVSRLICWALMRCHRLQLLNFASSWKKLSAFLCAGGIMLCRLSFFHELWWRRI